MNLFKKLSTTLSNIINLFLPPIILLIISGIINGIIYWFTGDINDIYLLGFIIFTLLFLTVYFGILYKLTTEKLHTGGKFPLWINLRLFPLWIYLRLIGLSGIIFSIIITIFNIYKYNINVLIDFFSFEIFAVFEYNSMFIGSISLLVMSEILRYLKIISESIKNNDSFKKNNN
jgi:hypothetical protein